MGGWWETGPVAGVSLECPTLFPAALLNYLYILKHSAEWNENELQSGLCLGVTKKDGEREYKEGVRGCFT